jgi:hypothetical protein
MLSGSIQVEQVYKVLEIGISLTEWGSRGISTRWEMFIKAVESDRNLEQQRLVSS